MDDFMTSFEEFIYIRTYSRWIDSLKRREMWSETVKRYEDFMMDLVPESEKDKFKDVITSILNFEVMPSMRSLWTAGKALERENICGYNCASIIIDDPAAFSEILYILMCGAGAGFSVERQFINKMPTLPNKFEEVDDIIIVADSKLGWAEAYAKFIRELYKGNICKFDTSKVRKKGERLKTFGGRASGPEPLIKLFNFTRDTVTKAKGRKLNSIECHDIVCTIASIVVVGGVRRSATISLSNLSDNRMAHAKDGNYFVSQPQRALANNSVAYTEKPDCMSFLEEWTILARSRSGERGIFNREGIVKHLKKHVKRRNPNFDFVVNPCGEIILRSKGFCNLTEVVIRSDDTLDTLMKKVEKATILGCVQSTLTKFKFLRKEWTDNAEEERLLGVSLTGLRDHPILNHVHNTAKFWLEELKQHAINTSRIWAAKLEINEPAAVTTVKPSGTVSLLNNTSSGLHTRFAKYYIRRVRVSRTDPLCVMMVDQGIPWQPENGETIDNWQTAVFEFPIKSPDNAVCNNHTDAIEMLEYWKMLKVHWCEHNPSCTIFIKDDEWVKVGNWVYENWNKIGGLSFLPADDSSYTLPPYEKISSDDYENLFKKMPRINFNELSHYETKDGTKGAQELACSGGSCELV